MAQLLAATLLAAISYRDIVEQDHTGRKSALDELRSTARGIESHIRPHQKLWFNLGSRILARIQPVDRGAVRRRDR
jgi:hypothetical protein